MTGKKKVTSDPRLIDISIGVVGPGMQPEAEHFKITFYAKGVRNHDAALLFARALERLCAEQALLEKKTHTKVKKTKGVAT